MRKILQIGIIYHSRTGRTKVIAEHIAIGAHNAGAKTYTFECKEAIIRLDELDSMDAIIFGCPTFMGSTSAEFKSFIDATGIKWSSQKWRNKIAAGFTNSGAWSGDKLCTITQLAIFAAQHGMIWVGLDLKAGFSSAGSSQDDLNRVGSWLGLMTQSNSDQGLDISPPMSDLKTAEYFGQRIYSITKQFINGKEYEQD
jgi:multimeric flavodoxin WrbA